MHLYEVMTAPVYTIGEDEEATAAWETMRFRRTRHLVVNDADGHVVGVISASDLGGKHGEPLRLHRRVRDLMTANLVTAHLGMTVREAANLMRGHRVNCLPVFNERDRLKGIVTAVDLLELIGRGAERPTAAAERKVLKDRGVVPRQATARHHTTRAAGR